MEEQLQILEKHVASLEARIFDKPVVIPEPPFRPEDHIDPGLIQMSKDRHLDGFCAARRVPADYYQRELEYRRDCIGAQSIDQLCKCVIYEIKDTPDPLKRYICLVVQYVDKISPQKLLDVASVVCGKKVTEVTQAKEEDATKLSGSINNAMTPVYLRPTKDFAKYHVAVVLSDKIASLNPPFFWLGGGEVDVKYGITTQKFVSTFNPIIYNISK
ncbi:hypothetical protein TRFO_08356 [Tritrichomonas foetus]|uniref:YbaK/aminoacyl-tRNA synthetase-associated domain-containing protein n=1 Tax=Tritrichomonas foetus TaxID=1144522 RepID=A0A1J4JPJ2_9EUKA|nr:hypothetical protein TRFO_08356 [Tritrichomonas foetus]|eukprot:OHS99435.1 hypothetical protein TRFO_08356 [Tritrichomonas foetus]